MKTLLALLLISVSAGAALIPDHEQQIQVNIQQQLVNLQNINNTAITRLMNTIWHDKSVDGCQVMSDLGTNAAPLRVARANFVAFINSQGGNITASEPANYILSNNQDGTVNCAPSPVPSASPSPSPSSGP